MSRADFLLVFLVATVLFATHLHADEHLAPNQRTRSFHIGNRDEPTVSQVAAIAKTFFVSMRRHGGEGVRTGLAAIDLRRMIDPRYLKLHELESGDLPIATIAVAGISTLDVADDNRTVLATAQTDSGTTEAIMVRISLHDKRLWITPIAAPDETSHFFRPWILRTEIPSG